MQKLKPQTGQAHYYDVDGTPRHTVIGSTTNRERNATIRDAKKHGWLPSVTTVIKGGMPTPYGLVLHEARSIADQLMTLPRGENETDDEYIQRVQAEAEREKSYAPDLGSEVHAMIARYLEGKPVGHADVSDEAWPIFHRFRYWIDENVDEVYFVESTGIEEYDGYAGTIDLGARINDGANVQVDFKTQGTKGKGKVKHRFDWHIQHGAYAWLESPAAWWSKPMLWADYALNVCVATDMPEQGVQTFKWDQGWITTGRSRFLKALDLYYDINDWRRT
jgi:hypothetical protein